jgi:hypothetical protein
MREESTNQMRKETWEGIHFEERIAGNGEILNVSVKGVLMCDNY